MATNGTEVYIKLPTGRSSRYDTHPGDKLKSLCDKIASEEGVAPSQVNLKYQGKVLDPSKTIGQYGIRGETILKAELLVPQTLDIVVCREGEDPSEEVVISNLETVSELYAQVGSKLDIPTNKLQIKIEGRVLSNSTTTRLVDAGIARGSTIVATVKPDVPETTETNKSNNIDKKELDEEERQNVLSSFDARGKPVEVTFSFDTTGSMYGYLTEIRTKLRECCTRLIQDIPNIRISIIAQGDYCDSDALYAVRILDLTSDVQSLVDFANDVPSTCGGDSPECYELVLKKAQELDWSEDSAKALVVIGDLYPHPPSYTDQGINWRDELNVLTGLGVKVYGVQAGNNSSAGHFYRKLAEGSGGCHLFLGQMDVITDMFLAVCYNEGNDDNNEMLENFEQELVQAGNMTDQKQEMFKQLKQRQDVPSRASSASNTLNDPELRQPWWDMTLDTATRPQYCYNTETDKWLPATNRETSTRKSIKKRLKGAKCAVM